jgi:hypothetical protein
MDPNRMAGKQRQFLPGKVIFCRDYGGQFLTVADEQFPVLKIFLEIIFPGRRRFAGGVVGGSLRLDFHKSQGYGC